MKENLERIVVEYNPNSDAFTVKREVIDPNDVLYPIEWWWHEGEYETLKLAYLKAVRKFPDNEIIKRLPTFYNNQVGSTGKL